MSRRLETQFRSAALALQQGDARTARQGFLKLTRKLPNSVAAWYNLGLSYQHLGDHERAVSAYKKAAALDPGAVDAWVGQGLSQKHRGDNDSARACADKALAIDPRHPRALNLMGTLEAERGQHDAARRCFEQCLELQPDNTDATFNLANLCFDMGEDDEADRTATSLLQRLPNDRRTLLLKARVLVRKRSFNEASSILEQMRDDNDDEDVLRADLELREAVRDHFGAIEVAGELTRIVPEDGRAWNSLGTAYFQLDSIGRAQSHYQRAIELEPDNSEFQNNLGLVYASMGDRDAAGRHYRRALELDPHNAEAYRNIAAMRRYESLSDPDIESVEALWRETGKDDPRAIALAFTLGKMYDDCMATDDAFSVYEAGNDLKFRDSRSGIDLPQYFAHMDRIASALTERPPAPAKRVDGPQPIFVLGMPRSGTTLVEQILARHPDVLACGELPCIERAIMHLEKRARPMRAYPDDFPSIGSDELTLQAGEYMEWVGRLHELQQPFLTDKMPYNFVHVWLVKALFPEAAVVHCRRHPLDVILSNYFQLYGSEVSFVYNLETLADYTVRYFRLTRHWKRLFGDEIVEVDYEALVNDADQETRRLVDAVGLPWDEACLDQRSAAGPVRTASIWQVRQGIYTSSTERWRRYERHLAEAVEVLVREGVLDSESLQPVLKQPPPA